MPECVTTTFHRRRVQSHVESSPNKVNDKIQWEKIDNGLGVAIDAESDHLPRCCSSVARELSPLGCATGLQHSHTNYKTYEPHPGPFKFPSSSSMDPLLETEAPNGSYKADREYRPTTRVYVAHHSRLVIVVTVPGLAENNLAKTLNRKLHENLCLPLAAVSFYGETHLPAH